MIEEDFGIVTSSSRYCIAFIHDNLYKPWSRKILKDFSDDYDQVDDSQAATKVKVAN